jgi:serine protease Do
MFRSNSSSAGPPPAHKPRVFAVALTALLVGAVAMQASAKTEFPDFEKLVARHAPEVVDIQVMKHVAVGYPNQMPEFLQRFFDNPAPHSGPRPMPPPEHASIGSGVIATADGYILTNAHVVAGADKISVRLHDKRELDATVVGRDERTDIALLKVDATGLAAAKFGDPKELRVGQWVLAIGTPFGLEQTATQGIISALSRNLPNDAYVPFIQTDVALNPGNSGGPLFNLEGEVIGINSQILSRTGGYMGLSFAIPIDLAANIAEQLKTNGVVARGWLGIGIQDLDESLAESFGLETPDGALVSDVVPGGPAEHAGMRRGDVILEFDDRPIASANVLPPLVAAAEIGTEVPVVVMRAGTRKSIAVTIRTLQDRSTPLAASEPARFGVVVSDMTKSEREAVGLASGVRVDRVEPGTAAHAAGVLANDIIVSFNHRQIDNAEELAALAMEVPGGKSVPVLVQRGGQTRFLALKAPADNTG